MRLTKGAIGNLLNRYYAVLKKCLLINCLILGGLTGIAFNIDNIAQAATSTLDLTSYIKGTYKNGDNADPELYNLVEETISSQLKTSCSSGGMTTKERSVYFNGKTLKKKGTSSTDGLLVAAGFTLNINGGSLDNDNIGTMSGFNYAIILGAASGSSKTTYPTLCIKNMSLENNLYGIMTYNYSKINIINSCIINNSNYDIFSNGSTDISKSEEFNFIGSNTIGKINFKTNGTINNKGNLTISGIYKSTSSNKTYITFNNIEGKTILKSSTDSKTNMNVGCLNISGGSFETEEGSILNIGTNGLIVSNGEFINNGKITIAGAKTTISVNVKGKGTIDNIGTITFQGCSIDNEILGGGTTKISGTVVANNSIANKITIQDSSSSLNIDADNIKNTVSNKGTLILNTGTISKDIDSAGTIQIKGTVINNASIENNVIVNGIFTSSFDNLTLEIEEGNNKITNNGIFNLTGDKIGSIGGYSGQTIIQENVSIQTGETFYNPSGDSVISDTIAIEGTLNTNSKTLSMATPSGIPTYATLKVGQLTGQSNLTIDIHLSGSSDTITTENDKISIISGTNKAKINLSNINIIDNLESISSQPISISYVIGEGKKDIEYTFSGDTTKEIGNRKYTFELGESGTLLVTVESLATVLTLPHFIQGIDADSPTFDINQEIVLSESLGATNKGTRETQTLSINFNGMTVKSGAEEGAVKDWGVLVAESYTLNLNGGTNTETEKKTAKMSGFSTAATVKGTLNVTDIFFSENTTDIAVAEAGRVKFFGENSLSRITGLTKDNITSVGTASNDSLGKLSISANGLQVALVNDGILNLATGTLSKPITGEGTVILIGNVSADADYLANKINNNFELTLTRGSISKQVSGNGSILIDGVVTSTPGVSIANSITISSGTGETNYNSFAINASDLGNTVSIGQYSKLLLGEGNLGDEVKISGDGITELRGNVSSKPDSLKTKVVNDVIGQELILTSGTLQEGASISGGGTTVISGQVTAKTSVENAITINETSHSLAIDAQYIKNTVTVAHGTLLLTGTLEQEVSGDGITKLKGNVTSDADYLKTKVVNDTSNQELTLTHGTLTKEITGRGSTIIEGTVIANSTIENRVLVNESGVFTASWEQLTNTAENKITNNGTFNLIGNRVKSIAGSGTTKLQDNVGDISVAQGALIGTSSSADSYGTLDVGSGNTLVMAGDEVCSSLTVGTLKGNSKLTIDIHFDDSTVTSDQIYIYNDTTEVTGIVDLTDIIVSGTMADAESTVITYVLGQGVDDIKYTINGFEDGSIDIPIGNRTYTISLGNPGTLKVDAYHSLVEFIAGEYTTKTSFTISSDTIVESPGLGITKQGQRAAGDTNLSIYCKGHTVKAKTDGLAGLTIADGYNLTLIGNNISTENGTMRGFSTAITVGENKTDAGIASLVASGMNFVNNTVAVKVKKDGFFDISKSTFTDNTTAIKIDENLPKTVKLDNVSISQSDTGINIDQYSKISVNSSTITNNNKGIFVGKNAEVAISDSTLTENTTVDIEIDGSYQQGTSYGGKVSFSGENSVGKISFNGYGSITNSGILTISTGIYKNENSRPSDVTFENKDGAKTILENNTSMTVGSLDISSGGEFEIGEGSTVTIQYANSISAGNLTNNGKICISSSANWEAGNVFGKGEIDNNKNTFTLTGGTVENSITGAGTTSVSGLVDAKDSIENTISIWSGANLSIKADNLKNSVIVNKNSSSAGILTLTGGTAKEDASLGVSVSGNGTTIIDENGKTITVGDKGSIGTSIVIAGTSKLTATASQLSGDAAITNDSGTLILSGSEDSGIFNRSVIGTGSTIINGEITANGSIANTITVNAGKKLTISANNLDSTTANAGELVLTGGQLDYGVSASGKTTITGNVIAGASIANNVEVKSGATFNASFSQLDGNISVAENGVFNLGGDTLKSISGSGTTVLQKNTSSENIWSVLGDTTITGTLDVGISGEEITAKTLNMQDADKYSTLTIGTLTGSANLKIDVDVTDSAGKATASDKISSSGGIVTLTNIAVYGNHDLSQSLSKFVTFGTGNTTFRVLGEQEGTISTIRDTKEYIFTQTSAGSGTLDMLVQEVSIELPEFIQGETSASSFVFAADSTLKKDIGETQSGTTGRTAKKLDVCFDGYELKSGAYKGVSVASGYELTLEGGIMSGFETVATVKGTLKVEDMSFTAGKSAIIVDGGAVEFSNSDGKENTVGILQDVTQSGTAAVSNTGILNISAGDLQANLTNKGILKLAAGTLAKTVIGNSGSIVLTGNVSANASYLGNSVNNAASELILTGGQLNYDIAGNGTTVIDGSVIASAKIEQQSLSIKEKSSLSISRDLLSATENDGTLILTGQNTSLKKSVSGDGISYIEGSVVATNDALMKNKLEITSKTEGASTTKGSFTANAKSLQNSVVNRGVLNLTGGTLDYEVSGAGDIYVKGSVTNKATVINSVSVEKDMVLTNNGKIVGIVTNNGGSIVSDASTLQGNVVNSGELKLISGTMSYNVSGVGTTIVTGEVYNEGTNENALTVMTGGTLVNTGLLSGNVTNEGSLTSSVSKLTGEKITNNGIFYMSGDLSRDIEGKGTTKIVSSIAIVEQDTIVSGTLDIDGVSVEMRDKNKKLSLLTVGNLTGKGSLSIDADMSSGESDRVKVGSGSTNNATVKVASINVTNDSTSRFSQADFISYLTDKLNGISYELGSDGTLITVTDRYRYTFTLGSAGKLNVVAEDGVVADISSFISDFKDMSGVTTYSFVKDLVVYETLGRISSSSGRGSELTMALNGKTLKSDNSCDGVTVASGYTLNLNGPDATITGFGTAFKVEEGAELKVSGVEFSGNKTDIRNKGILSLTGTNTVSVENNGLLNLAGENTLIGLSGTGTATNTGTVRVAASGLGNTLLNTNKLILGEGTLNKEVSGSGSVVIEADVVIATDVSLNASATEINSKLTVNGSANLGGVSFSNAGLLVLNTDSTVVADANPFLTQELGSQVVGIDGTLNLDFGGATYTAKQYAEVKGNLFGSGENARLNFVNAKLHIDTGDNLAVGGNVVGSSSGNSVTITKAPVVASDGTTTQSAAYILSSVIDKYVQVVKEDKNMDSTSDNHQENLETINITSQVAFSSKGLEVARGTGKVAVKVSDGSCIAFTGGDEDEQSVVVMDGMQSPVITDIVIEANSRLNFGVDGNKANQKGTVKSVIVNGGHNVEGNGSETTDFTYTSLSVASVDGFRASSDVKSASIHATNVTVTSDGKEGGTAIAKLASASSLESSTVLVKGIGTSFSVKEVSNVQATTVSVLEGGQISIEGSSSLLGTDIVVQGIEASLDVKDSSTVEAGSLSISDGGFVKVVNAILKVQDKGLRIANGGTLFLDPVHFDSGLLADDNTLSGGLYIGDGTVALIGADDSFRKSVYSRLLKEDSPVSVTGNLQDYTVGSGEAVLALGSPMKMSSGAKLIVDGTVQSTGSISGDTLPVGTSYVYFGRSSLLAVDGSKITKNAAITTAAGTTAKIADTAKLYIANAVSGGSYYILSVDSIGGSTGWKDENLIVDTDLLGATFHYSGRNQGWVCVASKSEEDIKEIYKGLDGELIAILKNLVDEGLYDTDSPLSGIKFLSRATASNGFGYMDGDRKGSVKGIESVARISMAGSVPQISLMASETLSDAMGNRMNIANSYNNSIIEQEFTTGISLWITPLWKNQSGWRMEACNFNYGYNANIGGVALGADYIFSQNVRAGLALNIGGGYAKSSGDLSSTENHMNFWGLGVYGGYNDGTLSVMGDASYTSSYNKLDQDIDQRMQMRNLKADVRASVWSTGIRGDYKFKFDSFDTTPHLGVRYTNISSQEYDIKSEGIVAKSDGIQQSFWSIPVGVTFGKDFKTASGWSLTPSVDFTVTPRFGDLKAYESVRFTGVSGDAGLHTQTRDHVTYKGTAGLGAKYGNIGLNLNYSYEAGSCTSGHGINASFRWDF